LRQRAKEVSDDSHRSPVQADPVENEVYVYDYPDDGEGRRYFDEKGFDSKVEFRPAC
jgi:hypothetical protein